MPAAGKTALDGTAADKYSRRCVKRIHDVTPLPKTPLMIMKMISRLLAAAAMLAFSGCAHSPVAATKSAAVATVPPTAASPREKDPGLRKSTYTPRVYPVDERGFSPVDKALAKAYAREDLVTNDDEGSLNPFVLKVITGYPLDGSYQYHCSWKPWEYDIYNGVTQD